MAQIKFTGPLHRRIFSFMTLNRIGLQVALRHALGRRIAEDWTVSIETGIRFWRHQFTKAMAYKDMAKGRVLFDSLLTQTDDIYDVRTEACPAPHGLWLYPKVQQSKATILYLHGGGYTFNGPISQRYGEMLAHHCGARVFMPRYRLTPEHPHPAQAQDALAAWHYLRKEVPADQIVVIGDSAGGHMALMLLQSLKAEGRAQPALCVGLCPWTDIAARGASLRDNDRFDLVQGWMALQFGAWLDPDERFGRDALSPITYDFAGLAPLYIQAGGREILRDMITGFAHQQAERGTDIRFDLWPDMPHNFQAYDSLKASSTAALRAISEVVALRVDNQVAHVLPTLEPLVAAGPFARQTVFGRSQNEVPKV